MKKHLVIKVSGVVQGVFFRASAKARADELGVTGLVRNEPDGSVYAEAEGSPEALEQFVAWCHQGPERARVDRCQVTEGQLKGYTQFLIERR